MKHGICATSIPLGLANDSFHSSCRFLPLFPSFFCGSKSQYKCPRHNPVKSTSPARPTPIPVLLTFLSLTGNKALDGKVISPIFHTTLCRQLSSPSRCAIPLPAHRTGIASIRYCCKFMTNSLPPVRDRYSRYSFWRTRSRSATRTCCIV